MVCPPKLVGWTENWISLVTLVPAGIKPAQSTQAWTVWVVQSQLNQYLAVTVFKARGPLPVFTIWICGWGLFVESAVTPLKSSIAKLPVPVAGVLVAVGGTGVLVKVLVGGTGV